MTEKNRMTALHRRNRAIQDRTGRTVYVEYKMVEAQPCPLVNPLGIRVEKSELENGNVRLRTHGRLPMV